MALRPNKFRQVEEKNILTEVELMEWSPKMDLIALSNVQGEVVMQRLSWRKVWVFPSRGDRINVQALAWRPDSKVLAIGYTNSTLLLCDVENAEILHTLEFTSPISTARWISATDKSQAKCNPCFRETASQFLPQLPCLSKSYGSLSKVPEENTDDAKKLNEQKFLNVLCVGTETGKLHMFIYGVFPAGEITPTKIFNDLSILQSIKHQAPTAEMQEGSVLCTMLSDLLSHISVAMETRSKDDCVDIHTFSFRTPLLESRQQELQILSLKYGQILSLMGYLSTTIHSISEAWEDILLEIDSKLTVYAEEKFKNDSGTVSDDFLELLMLGTPSDELERFLMNTLTEKGLKKLGHSIELSYSNIQKLVLKHVQSVGNAIAYHLSEVRGMALWYDKFGMLGLSTKSVEEALSTSGSFLLKATELQQVIDSSMRNFKAFFRWLYAIILRLSDEPIPPEINKVNQQDLNFVTEFLTENFTEEWDPTRKHIFNLEKVGQYLKDEALQFPPDVSQNAWVQYLDKNPSLKAVLFPHQPEKSLFQQHVELQDAVNKALNGPSVVMAESVRFTYALNLYRGPRFNFVFLQNYSASNHALYTVYIANNLPCEQLIFVEQDTQCDRSPDFVNAVRIKFEDFSLNSSSTSDGANQLVKYKILGIQFFNKDILSVLLIQDAVRITKPSILAQVPLKSIVEILQPIPVVAVQAKSLFSVLESDSAVNVWHLIEMKQLERMRPYNFAVSGSRKVACVLFASRRRVRLFEMDPDEEEDENEETDVDDGAMSERRSKYESRNENEEKDNTSKLNDSLMC
uniref:Anaphase-promoting complex subunit 4 n=1 Tax=Strigamia maritima TaxID=126957 RepID=T1IJR4_STRMM